MRILIAMMSLAILSGCGGSVSTVEVDSPLGAVQRAGGRVDQGVLRGDRAQAQTLREEHRRLLARYNPPQCDCPPFEVWVRGRWVRHWLWDAGRPDIAVQPEIVAEAVRRGGQPLYALRARFNGERRAASNENEYLVLEVTSAVFLGELAVPRALDQLGAAAPARTGPSGAN